MRRHLTPLMVAVAIGLSVAVPPPPSGSPATTNHPPAGMRPMASLAGLLPVAQRDGDAQPAPAGGSFTPASAGGMASAPGCAQSAPLFRSAMPRFVSWQEAKTPKPDSTPQRAPGTPPGAAPFTEEAAQEPAMHQALHLCVVDRFAPSRPLGGASRAVYRL